MEFVALFMWPMRRCTLKKLFTAVLHETSDGSKLSVHHNVLHEPCNFHSAFMSTLLYFHAARTHTTKLCVIFFPENLGVVASRSADPGLHEIYVTSAWNLVWKITTFMSMQQCGEKWGCMKFLSENVETGMQSWRQSVCWWFSSTELSFSLPPVCASGFPKIVTLLESLDKFVKW